jgi:hypothetical protein
MAEANELSNLSLEELQAKQKSLSNWQKIFIAVAVFSVGSALYAIYIKSKMHPWWILGALFFLVNNGSKLKKIESEIEKRKN